MNPCKVTTPSLMVTVTCSSGKYGLDRIAVSTRSFTSASGTGIRLPVTTTEFRLLPGDGTMSAANNGTAQHANVSMLTALRQYLLKITVEYPSLRQRIDCSLASSITQRPVR